jgi:hypothetical protein
MRNAPPGVHRERAGECRPPVWYVVWLGVPQREGSVIIGRSKRLDRHLWHRFFPEAPGHDCQDIKGWVNGARWLLDVHEEGSA